jgi:hypothetical protein
MFACNSTGAGQMARMDTRSASVTDCGFLVSSNWTTWSGETVGNYLVYDSIWYTVKITISSAGAANMYVNNVLIHTKSSITNNGTYMGFNMDYNGNNGGYVDNIYICNGVV